MKVSLISRVSLRRGLTVRCRVAGCQEKWRILVEPDDRIGDVPDGVLFGPGVNINAQDWPEGTEVEITVRIRTPAGTNSTRRTLADLIKDIEMKESGGSNGPRSETRA